MRWFCHSRVGRCVHGTGFSLSIDVCLALAASSAAAQNPSLDAAGCDCRPLILGAITAPPRWAEPPR